MEPIVAPNQISTPDFLLNKRQLWHWLLWQNIHIYIIYIPLVIQSIAGALSKMA